MALTHRDLAGYVAALYGPDKVPGAPTVDWLYKSNYDANVYMGLVRHDGALVVVTRGSFDFQDWWHDIIAKPFNPIGRPEIKQVHAGFYSGTPEAWDLITDYRADDALIFCGHSLGAARAVVLAAHAVAHGIKPVFVCCWGEPAAMKPFGNELLEAIPGTSYRNVQSFASDPVTVSTNLFGYAHRYPLVDLAVQVLGDGWNPIDLHHFALYAGATPDVAI